MGNTKTSVSSTGGSSTAVSSTAASQPPPSVPAAISSPNLKRNQLPPQTKQIIPVPAPKAQKLAKCIDPETIDGNLPHDPEDLAELKLPTMSASVDFILIKAKDLFPKHKTSKHFQKFFVCLRHFVQKHFSRLCFSLASNRDLAVYDPIRLQISSLIMVAQIIKSNGDRLWNIAPKDRPQHNRAIMEALIKNVLPLQSQIHGKLLESAMYPEGHETGFLKPIFKGRSASSQMHPNMVTKLVMPTRLFAWEQKDQSDVEGLTMPTKRKRIRNPSKSKRKRDADGRAVTIRRPDANKIDWTEEEDLLLLEAVRTQLLPVNWMQVAEVFDAREIPRRVSECLKRWIEIKGRRPRAKKKWACPQAPCEKDMKSIQPGPMSHYMSPSAQIYQQKLRQAAFGNATGAQLLAFMNAGIWNSNLALKPPTPPEKRASDISSTDKAPTQTIDQSSPSPRRVLGKSEGDKGTVESMRTGEKLFIKAKGDTARKPFSASDMLNPDSKISSSQAVECSASTLSKKAEAKTEMSPPAFTPQTLKSVATKAKATESTKRRITVNTKRAWTKDEDAHLVDIVNRIGPKDWSAISKEMHERGGKQCRERWVNHLSPDVSKEAWTDWEDLVIAEMHASLGNHWAEMAKLLPGRTDNAVKNRFYSGQRRKMRSLKNKITLSTNSNLVLASGTKPTDEASLLGAPLKDHIRSPSCNTPLDSANLSNLTVTTSSLEQISPSRYQPASAGPRSSNDATVQPKAVPTHVESEIASGLLE